MNIARDPRGSAGFSLLELLVVIGIALIFGFALGALFKNMKGLQLAQAGQLVGDSIALARQEAVKSNKEVRIVFLNTDQTDGWEVLQLQTVNETVDGPVIVPIGKPKALPGSVMVMAEESLSPLLTASSAVSGQIAGGVYDAVAYSGFRIRSNGSLDAAVDPDDNFLTLKNRQDSGSPPANYYTIQVNPVTGAVRVHRP